MAWLGSAWHYRKQITIAGTADGIQTNYQMKLVINRSAGVDSGGNVYVGVRCEADYDDIRITNSDGATLRDYWVESSDANSATIWIEFNSIAASPSNTNFYLYYGNPAASAVSNGADTFIFFDNFADLTQWGTVNGVSVAGGIATVLRTGGLDAYLYSTADFGTNTAIRSRLKVKYFGGNYVEDFGYNDWAVSVKSCRGYYAYLTYDRRYVTYNTVWTNVGAITGVAADTYFIQDVIRSSTTSIIWKVDNGNAVTATVDLPTINMHILASAVNVNDSRIDIDWVLVRNYTVTEPTWSTWGTEEGYGVRTRSMMGVGC